MLLQFTVENFRSFKTSCMLSLEAGEAERDGDDARADMRRHVAVVGEEHVLRTAAVFGANAAGKSNLFKAIGAAILLLRTSNMRQVGEPLLPIVPFAFSEETKRAPSAFEFVFLAEGTKYVYGFSATREQIVTEYLYRYHTAHATRPATIFERDVREEPEYRFTNAACRKELGPIVARNTANKLFLATATAWNSKLTAVPFAWFQRIDTYRLRQDGDYDRMLPQVVSLLQADDDHSLKEFICQLLHKADINIEDYALERKDMSGPEFLEQLPSQLAEMLPPDIKQSRHVSVDFKFLHRVACVDSQQGDHTYPLGLQDESDGTMNLFLMSPILKQAFAEGRILCIDEFDSSLHPLLVLYLIGLFHDPEVNRKNAQLIISSHTTELLSSRVMRRDQIYFVEKDRSTGASELYSLDEFIPGASKDIRKAYLLGRYGAVPRINDGELPW